MNASRFLRLPPDIRNRVHGFTRANSTDLLAGDPPLTRTCSQIRAECLDLFYVTGNLHISVRVSAKQQDEAIKRTMRSIEKNQQTDNSRPRRAASVVYTLTSRSFAVSRTADQWISARDTFAPSTSYLRVGVFLRSK